MKVLHVIDSFGMGGAEIWLLEVCKYLQLHPESNLTIDFLATGGKKALLDNQILETGAKIFYAKYSLKSIFIFRKKIIRLLETEKYDAIHNHQDFVTGWHLLASIGYWPPVRIMHLHNPYNFVRNYLSSKKRYFSYYIGKYLAAFFSTHLTGTSNSVMDEYRYEKWPFKRIRIAPIYCGFKSEKFAFKKSQKEKIYKEYNWDASINIGLFVGRIGLHQTDKAVNQKNPRFALDIAKYLCQKNANWRFLFAGFKGETGQQFEMEIASLGLSEKIKFLGIREDIPSLMSSAKFLLFPSFWEGLGMVAVEAQAAGLKVIASDTLPKEAIIIPELVHLINLNTPLETWLTTILDDNFTELKRVQSWAKIKKSNFSIENSVNALCRSI